MHQPAGHYTSPAQPIQSLLAKNQVVYNDTHIGIVDDPDDYSIQDLIPLQKLADMEGCSVSDKCWSVLFHTRASNDDAHNFCLHLNKHGADMKHSAHQFKDSTFNFVRAHRRAHTKVDSIIRLPRATSAKSHAGGKDGGKAGGTAYRDRASARHPSRLGKKPSPGPQRREDNKRPKGS